jgi:hypothetical protein
MTCVAPGKRGVAPGKRGVAPGKHRVLILYILFVLFLIRESKMVNEAQQNRSSETLWRSMILPEEDRRCQLCRPQWNGSYRWFRSLNVIDLWHYRSAADKQRIIEFMWQRQLRGVEFGNSVSSSAQRTSA